MRDGSDIPPNIAIERYRRHAPPESSAIPNISVRGGGLNSRHFYNRSMPPHTLLLSLPFVK
ncbi:MAG TPA: hypothetical protein IGS17_07190 [Oscillatoriales cyanobacterium M59_W2019_021]|nr:hypothetical protein [Oscillatoriales cyanobacterium M59_W2019_021]